MTITAQSELFCGGALHAPAIYRRAASIAAASNFLLLRDVADLRFGVKTGANEFFYLTSEQIADLGLESEYFAPIAFSLKEIRGYRVDPSAMRRRLLLCERKASELRGTALLRYIERGESEGLSRRPTCAKRKPWYVLARGWSPAPLLFPSKIGERMPIIVNDVGVLEDKKFYGITPHNEDDAALIGALLNSTITRLFVEFGSRQLTGSQAIADVDVVVAERLPLPDPAKISRHVWDRISNAVHDLKCTDCRSLFVEFGGRSPDQISLAKIKPELRRLDAIVMGELWGLSEDEQLEVYSALVDHVAARLQKAWST